MTSSDKQNPIVIRNLEAFVLRAPIKNPVRTSFGTMHDRPAVFIRLEDQDGFVGWGEIWCNFPNVGAEHRARLLNDVFKPLVINQTIHSPTDLYEALTKKTAVLAIQSGEFGPIAQVISGIDIGVWDLFSRRSHLPLWKYLGGINPTVNVYASGINPERPEQVIERCLDQGHKAFKLKVGFSAERDLLNLNKVRKMVPDHTLMVDANQAWNVQNAVENIQQMKEFKLHWIEEPIRADSLIDEWQYLAETCNTQFAAGENINSRIGFDIAIQSKAFKVLQPDIAKWGGISECRTIVKDIQQNGLTYCPHYLGGGIGLLASAHLLVASGSNGFLEIDSNENPLRTLTCGPVNNISGGQITLPNEIGLGQEPSLEDLSPFRILCK